MKLTDQQICIKLAEAMDICLHTGGWSEKWDKCVTCGVRREDVMNQTFDPLNDANDCEAVIAWLEKHHLMWIIVRFNCGQEVSVQMFNDDFDECWAGDDYKRGVCELALKVMT